MTLAWLTLQFIACALLIACAGFVLSRSADRLAGIHGWGRGWVGLALLATITSLPELASGVSAVTWVDAPNLAVGNALGACVANLAFLVVVDALQRHKPMYRGASTAHLLTGGFGVVMLGFVAMSLLTGEHAPSVMHVGIYSPLLLALYLLALRGVHAHEKALFDGAIAVADWRMDGEMRHQWVRFTAAAVVVVAAGCWLPEVADAMAKALGLSRSFVGTVFMSIATTLPEMVVTVAALRVGALDMAIANLLGSNLFNVLVVAVDDVFYTRGPLLAAVAPVHAGTAVTALIMTGLVIVGLMMRPQGRVLRVGSWVSVGLIAAYTINAALVYLRGT
jgi:cation:H+ antiporter